MTSEQETAFGFRWGCLVVSRCARNGHGYILQVQTDVGKSIEIYVSRAGRSIRVLDSKGKELK